MNNIDNNNLLCASLVIVGLTISGVYTCWATIIIGTIMTFSGLLFYQITLDKKANIKVLNLFIASISVLLLFSFIKNDVQFWGSACTIISLGIVHIIVSIISVIKDDKKDEKK